MTTICRLCLYEGESAADLSEIRMGFPLSVIAMILCPVKIEDDSLPTSICAECLETITAAFKLRDVSNKAEQWLRSSIDEDAEQLPEIEAEEQQEIVYEKFSEEEKLDASFQSDTEQESELISIDNELITAENDEIIEEEDCEILRDELIVYEAMEGHVLDVTASYKVDCQNVHTKKSAVWNHFGYLTDMDGNAIATEKESYYCKICVEGLNVLKPRYKAESTATSVLFQHLIKVHGLSKADMITNSVIAVSHQPPELVSCEVCEKPVHAGSLSIHMGIEHENETLRPENISQYKVNCYKNSKSLAWDYFGQLENLQGEQVDEFHFYCRLCVEGADKLTPKYTKNTSTSILLNHLKNAHIPKPPEAMRKRRQLESIGGPNKKMQVMEFACKICNEVLQSKKNLNRHMSKEHNLDIPKKFFCDYEDCGKAFSMRDTLLKHVKHIHHGVRFNCDRCPAVLSTRMSRRRHIDTCHLKIRSFACDACDSTFTEQKSLKNHYRKVHEGIVDKNVSCDHCDLKFTNQWSLSRHMLTHTGEVS